MKPRLGLVTSVKVNEDAREVRAHVLIGHRSESRDIPVVSPHKNLLFVPENGDYLYVYYVEGNYIGVAAASNPAHALPELEQGDICFTLDENTKLHFSKQNDGTVNVEVSASGSVTIEAAGEVVIGDDTEAVQVAVQEHTHTESGGGVTEPPNEPGTTTRIE